MLKKNIKYSLWTLTFCSLIFVYLICFGQNRISLMLNQGTAVPSDLEEISIKRKRGLLGVLTNRDVYATATCKTSKQSLNIWLMNSDFEVIHYSPFTSIERQFFTSYKSLPQNIFDNKVEYIVQLKRQSTNSRLLYVIPIDSQNVFLRYEMEWN